MSETPLNPTDPQHQIVRNEYEHDTAVCQASVFGLVTQICLAVVIAGIFAVLNTTQPQAVWFVLSGCICAETGIGVFLCHCFFLFPRESTGRSIATFGSVLVASVQLVPSSNGYAIGPLFAYVVGFFLTGWFLHRLFGASLSMHGEDVFQNAMSTKVLLLLAPLLLLMGLIPTLIFMAMMPTGGVQPQFASTLIFWASYFFGLALVPILSIYACFLILRIRGSGAVITAMVVFATCSAPVVFEVLAGGSGAFGLWWSVPLGAYFLGLCLAYAPFHSHGFRPVWSKRKQIKSDEQAISFDEIE